MKGDAKKRVSVSDSDSNQELDFSGSDEPSTLEESEILDYVKRLGLPKLNESSVKTVNSDNTHDKKKNPPTLEKIVKQKNLSRYTSVPVSSSSNQFTKCNCNLHTPLKVSRSLFTSSKNPWHENLLATETADVDQPPKVVSHYSEIAKQQLKLEVELYSKLKSRASKSNERWLDKVLVSGTMADKLAAHTVHVQDSPLHSLSSIDFLLNLAKKKVRRESLLASETLKDVCLSSLIPENRKLIPMSKRPLQNFDQISGNNYISKASRLILWYFEDALKVRYEAFTEELRRLSQDTVPATKKKAIWLIKLLLAKKPDCERFLLSSLVNKIGDPDYKVAAGTVHQLLELLDEQPGLKVSVTFEVERLLYRPNVGDKAQYYSMCLLNQIVLDMSDEQLSCRLVDLYFSFFHATIKRGLIHSKIMSAVLTGIHRAYPFAKAHLHDSTLHDHINPLYKLIHHVSFPVGVQTMTVIFQVLDFRNWIDDRFYNALYGRLLDDRLRKIRKPSLFLNLVFKSLKRDGSKSRVLAFFKRLLQVCVGMTPCFISACLILVSEVAFHQQTLFAPSTVQNQTDDEEEVLRDVETEEDSIFVPGQCKKGYDPLHRNPSYSGADKTVFWELERLTRHYHPSVQMFAREVVAGRRVKYDGDPLEDFSLMKFLDRFSYRNPKILDSDRKVSVMEYRRWNNAKANVKRLALGSETYMKMAESQIPGDELLFYKYFKESEQFERRLKKKQRGQIQDVTDAQFDKFLDGYERSFASGMDFATHFTPDDVGDVGSDVSDEYVEEIDDDFMDCEEEASDEDEYAVDKQGEVKKRKKMPLMMDVGDAFSRVLEEDDVGEREKRMNKYEDEYAVGGGRKKRFKKKR